MKLERIARGPAGRGLRTAAGGAAIAALWLLLAGSLQAQELVAACALGVAAALGNAGLRREGAHRQPAGRWLRRLPRIFVRACADCGRVTLRLLRVVRGRPIHGRFRTVPFDVGDAGAADVGRRVLATLGTTLQPNTYVVGFHRARGQALVHQLDETPEEPIPDELRRRS